MQFSVINIRFCIIQACFLLKGIFGAYNIILREMSSASVWFTIIDVKFKENKFDCGNGHGFV